MTDLVYAGTYLATFTAGVGTGSLGTWLFAAMRRRRNQQEER